METIEAVMRREEIPHDEQLHHMVAERFPERRERPGTEYRELFRNGHGIQGNCDRTLRIPPKIFTEHPVD